MNKKISVGAAIALAAIAVAATFVITVNFMTDRFNNQMSELQSLRELYSKLQEINNCISSNAYYQPTVDVRNNNMAESYVVALRESGDAYARYYSAEEYAEILKQDAGKNSGIGISIMNVDESVYVYRVYRGSPAETAGFKAGDTITKVTDSEGKTLASSKDGYDKLSDKLYMAEGEERVVTLLHEDGTEDNVTIVAAEYNNETVWAEYYGETAVIRITAFNSDTDEKFVAIIDEIEKNSEIKGVIFDVRNNGGGQLTTVVNMLDRLLPEGDIVTEKNAKGEEIVKLRSDSKKLSLPMLVLVNESSASASELFACALRDYDKADLIGTDTYGKGCVQTTYVLSDSSAIVFTTAMYYPPASDNFDGKPLEVDVEVKMTEEESLKFYSLDEETDPQLKKALEILAENRNAAANAA